MQLPLELLSVALETEVRPGKIRPAQWCTHYLGDFVQALSTKLVLGSDLLDLCLHRLLIPAVVLLH